MSANWIERAVWLSLSTLVFTSAGCGGGTTTYSFQSTLPAQPGPPPPAPPAPPPPAPPPSSPPPTPPPVLGDVLDNGVIRIQMNDHAPIITRMWVNGLLAVPHDNIGADFQMSARSIKGNAYNPTLGGDCRGNPSILRGKSNWNAFAPGTPAAHGLLLDVDPRNYNEPDYPDCLGAGEVLPYDMKFAVTLGDGTGAPKELLALDLSIRKDAGSAAEDIVKGLSELPVIFLDNLTYRYAYYSTDTTPADGQNFQPMQAGSTTAPTHDTRQWPLLTNFFITEPGRAIMLCDRADALQAPRTGTCVAIYSHEGAKLQASRRDGAAQSLTMITTINRDDVAPSIVDFDEHTQRRLVVVGNPITVEAGIAWAEEHLAQADWKRW